jgi:hypothetical protein
LPQLIDELSEEFLTVGLLVPLPKVESEKTARTHDAERLAIHTWLNPPNRRMRTRTCGDEGGEDRQGSPDPDYGSMDIFGMVAA